MAKATKKQLVEVEGLTPDQIRDYASQIESLQKQESKLSEDRVANLAKYNARLQELTSAIELAEKRKTDAEEKAARATELASKIPEFESRLETARAELAKALSDKASADSAIELRGIETSRREAELQAKELEIQSLREELVALIEKNRKSEEAANVLASLAALANK